MKELLIMAKSLGGGGSEVALIELINALPEELYNITLVLLDSDNEYAYRLKKNVNIVQLTFNSSFAKSLVSMYAFPAKVLKKLSVNIENEVLQALKKELSLLDSLYGDIQKEEQRLKEAHKKASRRKTLMEQELKNLKGEKMRMYEEYAAGTLSLDTYKQKKQECDRRISEVQEQIEQSKAEESTKSVVPGTVRAAAEQAENFLNGTRLTASMVSAFIENVFVYDGGRIVVRFKYEQSIQNAVKALHKD